MTKKRIIVFALLFLCAIPAFIINTPISYMPVISLLLFCVISLLYTALASRFCELEARPPELSRYERESSGRCTVTVHNRGVLLLPWVSLSLCVESEQGFPDCVTQSLVMLRPRERLELELPVDFPHIGLYKIRIRRLRCYDFLGVFFAEKKTEWSAPIHVTPKLYGMANLSLHTAQAIYAVDFSAPNKISGGEYADIRQYVLGDPLKNIHWKLSAHSSEYITRLFKTDAVSGVSVYIDLCLPEGIGISSAQNINDCAAECAYAAAARAQEQGYNVELIYSHRSAPTVVRPRDGSALMADIYSLPPVSANERCPVELLAAEHSGGILSPDNVIVITAAVSTQLIDVALDLRRRGKNVILCQIFADDKAPKPERDMGAGIKRHSAATARELVKAMGEAR